MLFETDLIFETALFMFAAVVSPMDTGFNLPLIMFLASIYFIVWYSSYSAAEYIESTIFAIKSVIPAHDKNAFLKSFCWMVTL